MVLFNTEDKQEGPVYRDLCVLHCCFLISSLVFWVMDSERPVENSPAVCLSPVT